MQPLRPFSRTWCPSLWAVLSRAGRSGRRLSPEEARLPSVTGCDHLRMTAWNSFAFLGHLTEG